MWKGGDNVDEDILLKMNVAELKRLNNSGVMPMPLTDDGRYDFSAMDKVYEKMGMPPFYKLSGYTTI